MHRPQFDSGNSPSREELARIRATLSRARLFTALSADAIEDLTRRARVRKVRKGTTIVSQAEPGNSMFVLLEGRVKVGIVGDTGREVTLSILRPGDGFGEMCLFDGRERSATVSAMEATVLLVLERSDMVQHLRMFPHTSLSMLSEMSRRLRNADENIAQFALCDVNERLVHRLVKLAMEDGCKTAEGRLVSRRPTQQELANMVGSCRETISRVFNQLVREGMIISRGRTMVVTEDLIRQSTRFAA